MTRFLEHHTAWITSLSPIHIGTGEDYEPTNSVFLDGVLVHFDPLALDLSPEDRETLISILDQMERYDAPATLVKIRGFFRRIFLKSRANRRAEITVPCGVAQFVRDAELRASSAVRKGKQGGRRDSSRDVINRIAVPRAIRHSISSELYLPGSSLKGALRTAWLEWQLLQRRPRLGSGRSFRQVEEDLLEGTFGTDPFRLIKIGDSTGGADGGVVLVFDVARGSARRNDPAIMQMVETALPGRMRAWKAGISVLAPEDGRRQKGLPGQRIGIKDLVAATNAFSIPRWQREMRELGNNVFLNKDWMKELNELLGGPLQQPLAEGRAALLRLGHFSGAEFVSLGRGARIEKGIPAGPVKRIKGRDPTPCIRMAARERKDIGALPFGWVLMELAPKGEEPPVLPELDAFCRRWAGWAGAGQAAHSKPGDAPPAGTGATGGTAEGGIDIEIPDSNNATKLRFLLQQVITSTPDKYREMLGNYVKGAFRGWSTEERALLIRLFDEHVRGKLGEQAVGDHVWKRILSDIAKLKSGG